ncbi:O-fucosyltransferase 13 isoform X1 [Brassica napus]|uniref:O-fucosyltransferase 13 isoform X1 n=1 Tax=Brassica napus TaxID=3708 RepID=UPI0006AB19DD|nr:O-fucosyltransferase 13 isoform X1 [Brassica napus]
MVSLPVKPLFVVVLTFSLLLAVILLSPSPQFVNTPLSSASLLEFDIWSVKRIAEWRPCKWWLHGHLTPLPAKSNGFIRVDCFGGLNQMRRDLCDGVGIARLLNATLVLPKFEVAAYWNESSGFGDVFDVDYFIQKMNGFIKVVKDLPTDISSKEPFRVDCSKRKGQFDYRETILPLLLEHHYISLTPAMSQRRDRYPQYAKATLCQACYSALRLTTSLEKKALELLDAIPKPFLSLHLRFEPDMVAYSRCEYPNLSPSSLAAIKAAGGEDKKPWTGEIAQSWRKRGKCPLTPNETALMLQSLRIPTSTNIYLAAGDGLMEMEGFTSVYTQVFTKSALLNREDFTRMHGNTKAALDYYVSINSDAYVATYFGNMDKMVAAMRAYNGMHKTLFLSRKAFAELSSQGLEEEELKKALWEVHRNDFEIGRGSALPDCFCEFKL